VAVGEIALTGTIKTESEGGQTNGERVAHRIFWGREFWLRFFYYFFWILKTNKSTSTFQVTTPAMAITYRPYTRTVDGEKELHEIKDLVSKDLSEPYSLYVFIYFIYKNPDLCIMVSTTVAPLQL